MLVSMSEAKLSGKSCGKDVGVASGKKATAVGMGVSVGKTILGIAPSALSFKRVRADGRLFVSGRARVKDVTCSVRPSIG